VHFVGLFFVFIKIGNLYRFSMQGAETCRCCWYYTRNVCNNSFT